MTSSSSENTKLLVTATAAAVAGATLGIGALKLLEGRRKSTGVVDVLNTYRGRDLSINPSVIYEDMSSSDLDGSLPNSNSRTLLFPHNHEEKMRRKIAAIVAVEEDNYLPRHSVTVRVPATSANMGPGCE